MSNQRSDRTQASTLPAAGRRTDAGPLRGVITPIVTPLSDRNSIDESGLERLIAHVLDGGVHALFVLGTSGEAAALSTSVRCELMRKVIRLTDGRVPILAGVCDNSVVDSLRLAGEFADMGASAIVLSAPSYLPVEQAEIVRYVRVFNEESRLPIMLYNIPQLTSHWFSVEAIRQSLELDNVIGLKDSSGDMSYFAKVLSLTKDRPDWSLFIGVESLFAESVKLGARGCVGGGSNVWPQLLVDIYAAAIEDDQNRLDKLRQSLAELAKIYQFGTYASGVIRGIKCALEVMGICSSRMADPFASCNAEERSTIEQQLRKLGLLDDNGSGNAACRVRSTEAQVAKHSK